jgi:RimJ/RimL family protein N-acetyltransferase
MSAPDRITTDRLVLRRPIAGDAAAIFAAYFGDLEVARYLSWPRHTNVAQTCEFIEFRDAEWARWSAGPYLIETREGLLLGGSGFSFQTTQLASCRVLEKCRFSREGILRGYAEFPNDRPGQRQDAICYSRSSETDPGEVSAIGTPR